MKRIATILLFAAVAASSLGLATFFKVFAGTYKAPAGSDLSKAMCRACHTSLKGKEVNLYGADVQKALHAASAKMITADILRKVEGLDSDKDGVKNGDELKKGTLPGDPRSK